MFDKKYIYIYVPDSMTHGKIVMMTMPFGVVMPNDDFCALFVGSFCFSSKSYKRRRLMKNKQIKKKSKSMPHF
jgi:hypothetical protein